MGTLLWQLNDCWPVASWAITDYSRQPKAAWYAVKEAYRDDIIPQRNTVRPKDLNLGPPQISWQWKDENTLVLQSKAFAKYVYVSATEGTVVFSDNYFDLKPGETKTIYIKENHAGKRTNLQVTSLYDVLK
jgi:beta-mannosidase